MSDLMQEKICPRCHYSEMKTWDKLNAEERMLAERLPASADFSPAERKRHRFCVRCWFELAGPRDETI